MYKLSDAYELSFVSVQAEKESGAVGRQGFIRDKISESWASISRRPRHVLCEKTIRLGN